MQLIRKSTILALTLTALGCAVVLSGCGKSSRSISTSTSESSSSPDVGNEAIEFHNKLVEFTKLARSPLSDIEKASDKMQQVVDGSLAVIYKPSWDMFFSVTNPYEKLSKSKLAAPSTFSKEDQAYFNTRITSVKSDADALKQLVSSLRSYFMAEDYKDDKFKKFVDAKPQMESLSEKISKACGEMGDRSEEITSAIERENLKKNPIGVYVLNMRDVMDKLGKQVEILADEDFYSSDYYGNKPADVKAAAVTKAQPAVDAAEKLAQEITDMATKYRAQDKAALKDSNTLAKDYDAFFTKLDTAQGEIRKTIRNLKSSGMAGTPDEVSRVVNAYKSVQGAHNAFIDDVNKGN